MINLRDDQIERYSRQIILPNIGGIGDLLTGKLLVFNALDSSFRQVKVPKDPHCPVCGENPAIKKFIDYEEFCQMKPKLTERQ